MKKLRNILAERFPDLITFGCNAHYLALLQIDVSNKSIMKHIVDTQKYFRNVHLAHGLLKEKGGKQPQLPNSASCKYSPLGNTRKNFTKYFQLNKRANYLS